MKFTDEELSRILGEHACGQLMRSGSYEWERVPLGRAKVYPTACINQVRFNESDAIAAAEADDTAAGWFDEHYQEAWTPEQFLSALERA